MPREFPKNNKNRKILYLIIWIILFIIMAIYILNHTNNKKPIKDSSQNKIVESDFEIKKDLFKVSKDNLLKINFAFKFTYESENTVIYEGKVMGNKALFTKESSEGILKYYIEDDLLYNIILEEKNLTDIDINHESFFDLDYLYSNIKETNKLEDNLYELTFESYKGILEIENENVKKITISNDNEVYILEFSDINNIDSLG